jgi:hypothetical protein
MNWKIIIGILLIYGGAKEFYDELNDYRSGVTDVNCIGHYFIGHLCVKEII